MKTLSNSYWQQSGEGIQNLENLHIYKSGRQASEIIKGIDWYKILTKQLTLLKEKKKKLYSCEDSKCPLKKGYHGSLFLKVVLFPERAFL